MQLEHEFSVPSDRRTTWQLLLDIERMARCMPGARVDAIDGDRFTGRLGVKLGPISMTYAGAAELTSTSEADGTMQLAVHGRDSSGRGTAQATITAALRESSPSRTTVELLTALEVTGRPAQMGGALLSEVGDRLVGQLAANLARELDTDAPDRHREPSDARTDEDGASVDLLAMLPGPPARRLVAAGLLLGSAGGIWLLLRRTGAHRSGDGRRA